MGIAQSTQELNIIIGVDSGIPIMITIYGFTYKVIGAGIQSLYPRPIGKLKLEYTIGEGARTECEILVSEEQIEMLLQIHANEVREKRNREKIAQERAKRIEEKLNDRTGN